MNRRAFFGLLPFLGLATRLKTVLRQPAKLPLPAGLPVAWTRGATQRAYNQVMSAVMERTLSPVFVVPLWHPIPIALCREDGSRYCVVLAEEITIEEFRERYPPHIRREEENADGSVVQMTIYTAGDVGRTHS